MSILVACKKNSNVIVPEPIPVVVIPKIKTITTPTNVVTHTYDTQGRLILLTNTSNNSKYEYTYANNTVTSNYYVGATLNTTKVLDLNADGLVIKESYTFPVINIPYKTNYTYNANKQRVAVIYSNTLNTDVTTYTNFYTGNTLDSAHTTNSSNNDITRSYYSYYTDKISTTNSKNRGSLFVGQEATMPIKKLLTRIFLAELLLLKQVITPTFLILKIV